MTYQPVLMRPLSEMDDATVYGLQAEVSREASFRRMRKEQWWTNWRTGRLCALALIPSPSARTPTTKA